MRYRANSILRMNPYQCRCLAFAIRNSQASLHKIAILRHKIKMPIVVLLMFVSSNYASKYSLLGRIFHDSQAIKKKKFYFFQQIVR